MGTTTNVTAFRNAFAAGSEPAEGLEVNPSAGLFLLLADVTVCSHSGHPTRGYIPKQGGGQVEHRHHHERHRLSQCFHRRLRTCQKFSISGYLLRRNVQRFRGGLVFKAHRLAYHSTLGSRVTKHGHHHERHRLSQCFCCRLRTCRRSGGKSRCGPISPSRGRDCVELLWPSYTGVYPQTRGRRG